jgi:transcriptional regulator GlxA family with amidase domain
MSLLKDQVIPLDDFGNKELNEINQLIREVSDSNDRIKIMNEYLQELPARINPIEKAIERIFSSNGMLTVAAICKHCGITERQLERHFKKYIGLSPKFYTRLIRFSYIFQIAQEKKLSWTEVGLESGFYDQPHFIKNFKAFTGEDPSRYFFDEPNLANFFLKKV